MTKKFKVILIRSFVDHLFFFYCCYSAFYVHWLYIIKSSIVINFINNYNTEFCLSIYWGPVHTLASLEEHENAALFLIRLGLTPIRHENRAYKRALQTGKISKPLLCVLLWKEDIIKSELFEKDDVTIILWFPCPWPWLSEFSFFSSSCKFICTYCVPVSHFLTILSISI